MLLTISTCVDARILHQKQRGCPDGSVETFTLFEDDCTGDIYTLYVDCLGNTYFNVPEPQWRAIFSETDQDPFPERFWEMVRTADLRTPGGLTGIYLLNVHGDRVELRNPYGTAEIAQYLLPCPSPIVN